jgi:septal ring factor EnvC (AmiA/AmiB activator)
MWPGSAIEDRDLEAELALAEGEVASLMERLKTADRTENELRRRISRLHHVIESIPELKGVDLSHVLR